MFTVDMRKCNLQIPKGGLLIGIEWIIIDENYVKPTSGFKNNSPA